MRFWSVNVASGPFTFAQLARAAGIGVDRVRLYRDRGLLQAARRVRGRHDDRAYYEEHLDRLRFIESARHYGFSLHAIAMIVDETGLGTCNDIYRIAVAELEGLRRERDPSDSTLRAFEQLIATCSRRGPRANCGILAALSARQTGLTRPAEKPGKEIVPDRAEP